MFWPPLTSSSEKVTVLSFPTKIRENLRYFRSLRKKKFFFVPPYETKIRDHCMSLLIWSLCTCTCLYPAISSSQYYWDYEKRVFGLLIYDFIPWLCSGLIIFMRYSAVLFSLFHCFISEVELCRFHCLRIFSSTFIFYSTAFCHNFSLLFLRLYSLNIYCDNIMYISLLTFWYHSSSMTFQL